MSPSAGTEGDIYKRQEAKNMTDLCTRIVKGPKPIWQNGQPVQPGEKIEVPENTALAKAHLLLTPEEFEANTKATAAALAASQAAKKARKAPEKKALKKKPTKAPTRVKKEADSKES